MGARKPACGTALSRRPVFSPVLFWLTIEAVKDNLTSDFKRELLPTEFQFAWA